MNSWELCENAKIKKKKKKKKKRKKERKKKAYKSIPGAYILSTAATNINGQMIKYDFKAN